MTRLLVRCLLPCVTLALLAVVRPAGAVGDIRLSRGQTVYVPVYSNVFSGVKALPFQLAVMLSVRNTDPRQAISLTALDYYDNDGRLLKKYLDKPLRLGPLASHHLYLPENERAGGFGANFIVRWEATAEINAPIVESVMVGAKSGQGISFVSPGQVIRD